MKENIIEEESKRETLPNGPLHKRRNFTDWPFIVAFTIFTFIWSGIATYSFCYSETFTIHVFNVMHHLDFYYLATNIIENFDSMRFIVLESIAFTLCFWAIFFVLCRWVTKVFVCSVIVLKFFGCIWLIYLMNYSIIRSKQGYWFLYILCILLIMLGIITYGLYRIGLQKICKVLAKSCRAIFFYPSTLFFVLIQCIACILVVVYGCAIFAHLNSIRIPHILSIDKAEDLLTISNGYLVDNRSIPFHIYIFHVINIFTTYWTSLFVMGIGRMTLTAAFATWYSAEDKSKISFLTLPKCFIITIRYHVGTILYASSLLWLVAMFRIVSKNADKLKKLHKNPVNILSWIIILIRFPFDALTICAMHGSPFYKSAKNSYELVMKNAVTYLTIDMITDCMILFGSFVVVFLTGLLADSLLTVEDETSMTDSHMMMMALSTVLMISFLISLSTFALFHAGSSTIRLCYFEDSKFNKETDMKLYEMQVDDLSLFNEKI